MSISIKTINDNIVKAGRLDYRIIGVYSQDTVPEGAVTAANVITKGNPCVAKALFKMAAHKDVPAIYVGEDCKECCFAAPSWFGYRDFMPGHEKMFASDSPSSGSYCLKKSMELYRESFSDIGKFTPPGKYIVMQPLSEIDESINNVKSILCFGTAIQIRNLGALIHFSEPKIYTPIMAPWGSGCAQFVAYPAGMASNCPKNTAILGSMSPEGNAWLPKDILTLGIPMDMAIRMAEGYEQSFAVRHPEMTYPDIIEEI